MQSLSGRQAAFSAALPGLGFSQVPEGFCRLEGTASELKLLGGASEGQHNPEIATARKAELDSLVKASEQFQTAMKHSGVSQATLMVQAHRFTTSCSTVAHTL